MTRQKVNPYQRKVAASVALQYKCEAQQSNMSLSEYIAWLKRKAGITTAYDYINARFEAERTAKHVNRIFKE